MAPAIPFIMLGMAAISAAGAVAAGNAQAKTLEYQQQVAEQKAGQQLDASRAQAQQVEQQNRQKMGQIQAAYAAAGVDGDSGSPLQVMHAAAVQGELGRQLTLYRGEIGAVDLNNQAALYGMQATNAQNAGYANAAGTLLTGATKFVGPSGLNIGAAAGADPWANGPNVGWPGAA